ncbi:MAG: DUF3472 domain-containing protein [Draconibacterium sp.]|nr:DUF3472 domain-containing protein [Draconibacterium sp.]
MKGTKQLQSFLLLISVFSLLSTGISCQSSLRSDAGNPQFSYAIPCEGNCWVVNDLKGNEKMINENGIQNWNSNESVFRVYFKVEKTGSLNIGILAKSLSGSSKLKVTFNNLSREASVSKATLDTVFVGEFNIESPGYQFVEIQGLDKSGEFFPEIESVLIGGNATVGKVYFARDDFYWGRRGPSVHLNFQVPESAGNVVYFYNEITIPENNDVLGSYFMANGFGQGYFGMQVNSPTERRILFSVWSPCETDNPGVIPEDFKIKLLKKGEEVYTGEFGNEGSGGQSFLKFDWKAGTTYRFLLKGLPTGNDATDFTAWFFAPEIGKWKLIASFRRPKTETYLTHLYSFLENFYTETGNVERRGLYSNQWIYNSENKLVELTKIKFTADATARKESRMDYAGGLENNSFFLKNCGFFSETTPIDSYFERQEPEFPSY